MKDSKLEILVVEDETIIRTSFVMMLEDMGHVVVGEAANGELALQMIEERKPNMVLLDINLPEINGLKVLEYINEKYHIPCIIITGYYSEEFLDRAKKAGAFNYLIKPIDALQLSAAIEVTWQRYLEYASSKREQQRLSNALEERKLVERAKGILMNCNGLTEEQAMRSLQKRSRDSNVKLADVARSVIEADRVMRGLK